MPSIITLEGEKLFALKAQANEQLDIDTFIFANVPAQDASSSIDRSETIPSEHIVHQQSVQQYGRINDNVVVYSTVLDSVTGPFNFNWVGLYSSVNDTLVAINHIPVTSKTVTENGVAGNTLNRNFGIEYSGIAELTGINVEPETWQLDYTARLNGMEELTRQLAADMNGKNWFIGDGFKVTPRETTNSFKVMAGVGYVAGLRIALDADHIFVISNYPQFVYVDAWFDGNSESVWKGKATFIISSDELDDYIDNTGKQHYVLKIAVVSSAEDVEDLRNIKGLAEKLDDYSSEIERQVSESTQELSGKVLKNQQDIEALQLGQPTPIVTSFDIDKPELIAHRGFRGQFPQNTMLAMSRALSNGADSLECDIQVSADGELFLFHDDQVNSLTNGSGTFTALNASYIESLVFDEVAGTSFASEGIPYFSELLKLAKTKGVYVYAEIKGYRNQSDIDLIISAIEAENMEQFVMLQSFDFTDLEYVRTKNQTIGVGYLGSLTANYETYVDSLSNMGHSALLWMYTAILNSPAIVQYCKGKSVGVAAWTVNTDYDAQRLKKIGVNKIMSDISLGGV